MPLTFSMSCNIRQSPFPFEDVLPPLTSAGEPPSSTNLWWTGPFVYPDKGPFLSKVGTRASRSTARPARQLKSAPPTLVPTNDFSKICLESIFRQDEFRLKKGNQLSINFSAKCWSKIHLSGLSRVDRCCLCLNFFSSLHEKFFCRRRRHHCPGYPKSRPVRGIKDCFASFLQKNATPPLLHSYWSAAYINITVWHASMARRPLIG